MYICIYDVLKRFRELAMGGLEEKAPRRATVASALVARERM